ncbi:MAG TPA: hypothetical protein DD477_13215 [Spirochaetaceae bacterium]|nr:MAG: hypothetical protein A2Y32_09645 [Spirochaetes bacterium GWF1_60_12]HBO42158.1 hypothetical protein [Spirochaetaceae bacterium]HCQ87158.1 hypothetical protein [Spirochaetaceae bacterium]
MILAAAALLGVAALAILPVGPSPVFPAGWQAVRDDAIAARFAPLLHVPAEYGILEAVYYRAAISPDGRLHLAYHPVWAFERNANSGFLPLLNRLVYTGGLSLQRLMFGNGDVELIVCVLDPAGQQIEEVWYERPAGYDPAAFSVSHEPRREAFGEAGRPELRVASWNHLFEPGGLNGSLSGNGVSNQIADQSAAVTTIPPIPAYFDAALWAAYRMTKSRPTRLFKHRAHFDWELAVVEPID